MKRETGAELGLAGQILTDMARRGGKPVLVAPGLRLGGMALAQVARNMALHLLRRGIGRGALVALRSDDLVVSLASILAVGLLGGRWAGAGVEGADLLLDTAPDGQLLPGAVLVDETWAIQPMPEAKGMFPGVAAGDDWLCLGGQWYSDAGLLVRFRDDAAVFDRPETAVVGLGGPEEPEQLLLALSTLYHGGVLVESAEPEVWHAEAAKLVVGCPETVAACLTGWTGERFPALQLWGKADGRSFPAFNQLRESGDPAADEAADASLFDLLDQLFRQIDGVTDAMTFMVPKPGRPDRLTAFLALEPGADLPRVTSEAKVAALRLGGQKAVPGRFLVADALPRRADGSPDREACRNRVLAARRREKRP
jgi:hypothetical protein